MGVLITHSGHGGVIRYGEENRKLALGSAVRSDSCLQLGEVRPTHRKQTAHYWRTRADPFENVRFRIQEQLELTPDITAKELFQQLRAEHPGHFSDGQIRTLRRRVISGLMESETDFVACDMPDANRLTIHILAAIAEHEREMISARTKQRGQQNHTRSPAKWQTGRRSRLSSLRNTNTEASGLLVTGECRARMLGLIGC